MMLRFVLMVMLALVAFNASADVRYFTNEKGQQDWVFDPNYKDPALHITKEDMKGMVHVTPEQERQMKEEIFREKLREEINIRKSQDFRLDDADALAEILAGKPRRF